MAIHFFESVIGEICEEGECFNFVYGFPDIYLFPMKVSMVWARRSYYNVALLKT